MTSKLGVGTVDIAKLADAAIELIPLREPDKDAQAALTALLRELLVGRRHAVESYRRQLITIEEAGNLVAAHVETWLVDRGDLRYGEWDASRFLSLVTGAILSADPRPL